jgi:hypothetical protein
MSESVTDPEWIRDFEASLRRPLRERFDFAFVSTRKPIIDDRPYRTFETMEEYRRWCREELPAFLGYA